MTTAKYTYHQGRAIPCSERLHRVEWLARWLDSKWVIPGTGIRIGLDGLLTLIPGIGDTISAVIGMWIVYEAHQMGLPRHLQLRMGLNLFVDWLVGLIPILGDVFDVAFKANIRNANIIRNYVSKV